MEEISCILVSCQRRSAFFVAFHVRFALMIKAVKYGLTLKWFHSTLLLLRGGKWEFAGLKFRCEFIHCLVNSKSFLSVVSMVGIMLL